MTTELATGFQVRNLTEADLPTVYELIQVVDLADFGEADYTKEDIVQDWQSPGFKLESDAWGIYTPGGQLVGYSFVHNLGKLMSHAIGFVHPEYYGRGIGTQIIRLNEARARECLDKAPSEGRVTLNNGINGRNEEAKKLLEREGYEWTRTYWRMRIELAQEPSAPQWPEGITFRPMIAGQDDYAVYQAVEESFSDHWGHLPRSFEEWKAARIESIDFDPSLWLLALHGKEVAGFSLGKLSESHGWVNTLGVRRAWRGKGLGRAVLEQSFVEFYRRGKRRVELAVDSNSLTGATRLYERAGMRVAQQYDRYTKVLRDGPELSTQELN